MTTSNKPFNYSLCYRCFLFTQFLFWNNSRLGWDAWKTAFGYNWNAFLEARLTPSCCQGKVSKHWNKYRTTAVLWPFSGATWVSWCQKKASSGLHGAREDNKRQGHTDNPGGHHSIRTNQQSTFINHQPLFLCRMPFQPQPSQFILVWDRSRNMLDCSPHGLVWDKYWKESISQKGTKTTTDSKEVPEICT